jgi:chromosome condensin MukBEF ATPase and DNA-binding subunit MukB
MSDEELVKRLRNFAQDAYDDLAADRIEALTAERDAWKELHAAEALGLHVQMQRAEAAEAKLAKAVEGLREIAGECGCSTARAIIADIEGEKT